VAGTYQCAPSARSTAMKHTKKDGHTQKLWTLLRFLQRKCQVQAASLEGCSSSLCRLALKQPWKLLSYYLLALTEALPSRCLHLQVSSSGKAQAWEKWNQAGECVGAATRGQGSLSWPAAGCNPGLGVNGSGLPQVCLLFSGMPYTYVCLWFSLRLGRINNTTKHHV